MLKTEVSVKNTTLDIGIIYDELGKAEKKAADYIISHPEEVLPLSIVELAEQAGCSEATIVRFCKKLGFSGYQEFKISFARETKTSVINANMSKDDNAFAIFEKVCNDVYCSFEKTKKILSPEKLQAAAEAIMNAKRIVVIGLGNSASIALDASHKLLRIGCNAYAYTDNHMQMIAVSGLDVGDLVIAISHSGSSKDIVEAMQIARRKGAITIAITNQGRSPIQKHSDIILSTASDETRHNILALNSRIVQLAIVDALYFYIVFQQSERSLTHINDTEMSLKTKKY